MNGTWESGRRGTRERTRCAKELREERARVWGVRRTGGFMAGGGSRSAEQGPERGGPGRSRKGCF